MNKSIRKFFLLLMAIFSMSIVLPIFAGDDDDFDLDGGFDGIPIVGYPVPIFIPYLDGHSGRALVQMPAPVAAAPIALQAKPVAKVEQEEPLQEKGAVEEQAAAEDQATAQEEAQVFPHETKKPMSDPKFNRQVVTLDHGCPNNPYQVCDHGLFHLGALVGAGVVEPHSGVQGNLISRWQKAKGKWSHRWAHSYDDAKKMKWGKTPKKAKDFDTWEIGDWMRKNGIADLTVYGGVSWATADVRGGGLVQGTWSRHIQKLGKNLIRVSFTKEKGVGGTARVQALPLEKTEGKKVKNFEESKVFLFDLQNKEERKALKAVLKKRVLRGGKRAKKLAEKNGATMLTSRKIKRSKDTSTPFSAGIPFMVRYRSSHHRDKPVVKIVNHRNGNMTTIKSRAYLQQNMHRYLNFRNKGKKWKYFKYSHQHYNRAFAGSIVNFSTEDGVNAQKQNERHLNVQISFSHDRAKVKKVNKYVRKFSKHIGINDFVLDTGYKKGARIGYVELVYSLKVGPEALEQLVADAVSYNSLFTNFAHDSITNYFNTLNDPHNICRSHIKNRYLCIKHTRYKTLKSLKRIERNLRRLGDEKVMKSRSRSAKLLAKIARELSTNHFVLHSFLLALPRNDDGYGKLEIFGERFLAKKFSVDPGLMQSERNDVSTYGQEDEDEVLSLDWHKTDALEEGGIL